MEEKKELQEIAHTEKGSIESQEKERINVEETEDLIKELLDEKKKEKVEDKESKKKSLRTYLVFVGLFILVITLFTGILVINYIIKLPIKEVAKEEKLKRETIFEETNKANQTLKEEMGTKKEFLLAPQTKEKSYPFKLELKNFLFPLDDKSFLKLDVYLYFENHENYKGALLAQTFLRELLVQEIGKKNSLTFWKNLEEVSNFEVYLVDFFKKGYPALSPAKIELEGIILRV
ncbi:MAG: hypothetical protein ACK4Y7_03630 [Caldimicrobium sp.]